MMFIGSYGVLWHSFMVMLYNVTVISWIMYLEGLSLFFLNVVVSFKHTWRGVMDYNIHPLIIGFCHIVTFIKGYAGMQCSWWLMLYCDIPEWLRFSMVVLLIVISCNYTWIITEIGIIIIITWCNHVGLWNFDNIHWKCHLATLPFFNK